MKFATLLLISLNAVALPLHFEPNRGQVKGRTEWTAGVGGAHVFLAGNEAKFGDVHMRLVGARRAGKLEGLEPTDGYSSYFIGRDEKGWVTGVPHYSRVRQRSVYPGIDVVYYASDRNVEYDFLVAPGADPKRIELAFDKPVRVDANGDLVLAGGVRQHRPRVFQDGREIAAEYRLTSRKHVEIALADYDRSRPLTIDPVVEFATYLGGPGSDYPMAMKFDAVGNLVIAGGTETPATPSLDPFQQTAIVGRQAFVMKLTPDAKRIILFATVGPGTAYGMAIASDGSFILAGETLSPDFPLKNPIQSDYKAIYGTGFFAKLTADGRSLVFSSYIGGSDHDGVGGVQVDAAGNAFFLGSTASRDWPVKNPLQSNIAGGLDCTVTKISATGAMLFSTYLGSSALEGCNSLILLPDGSLLFTGYTLAADFPTTKDAVQPVASATNFGSPFLVRMASDGQSLLYSSYIGGEGFSGWPSMDVDAAGNIYIGGRAFNALLTLKNSFQKVWYNDLTAFFMKLDPTGRNVMYSSFFASTAGNGLSLVVDKDQNVYLSGTIHGDDLPAKNSLQPWRGGGTLYQSDWFLAKINSSGQTLAFATYLGGSNTDERGKALIDSQGSIYFVARTQSSDVPTKNAFQPKFGGAAAVKL